MIKQKGIEPAQNEWAAPVVFTKKKDGTLRFCVDNKRLNALTKRDANPILRIDKCINSLGEATVFYTLDTSSGYWKVEMDQKNRDKTAFTSRHGLFRFICMPLGMRKARDTFPRTMHVILFSMR